MDNDRINSSYAIDDQQQVSYTLHATDGVLQKADPIALDIDDDDLIKNIDKRIEASKKFWDSKYNLTQRRRRNETYLFGRQVAELERANKLKEYETRYLDNALYEIEASLKPLAMSHLPDMIVLPGSDDPEKDEAAKELSIVVNDVNKMRKQRQVLAIGFKHLPVYFTAILKVWWNPELGEFGDFQFDVIHPEYVVIDHTSPSPNADDMSFIPQILPLTVQDVIMRFPECKDEFLKEVAKDGIVIEEGSGPTKQQLASEIKIWEIWFTWFRRKDTGQLVEDKAETLAEPGVKWERIEGVVWKYHDLVLKKIKNPNFDYEGETRYFTYDNPSDESSKKEVDIKDLLLSQLMGTPTDNVFEEKIYHNYFEQPRKPFFFFGYDQWGKVAIDETSRIEQNIRNQENLDAQGKQIVDTLKSRIKHIWSKDSALRSSDIQKMDMDDPKLDALVEGDVNAVHKSISPERPDAAQFKNLNDTRERMYSLSGASAIRGQLQSDVATTNQIAREADYTRADDLVEETINAACEWMAQWQMQFIKLRYTAEHLRQILGDKGTVTFIKLRRDMVSDGMEVTIKASSTDKLKAQKNAMEMAKLGAPFIDPLTFFEDMDMSDPKGRAEKGFMFAQDPSGYFAKYILDLNDTNSQVNALLGTGAVQNLEEGQPTVPLNAAPTVASQPPVQQPQNPTPFDTSVVPSQPSIGVSASPSSI